MTKPEPVQDIIYLIKKDHKSLKESIKVLCQLSSSKNEKIRALRELIGNLNLHAKAEEQALYENIVEEESLRETCLEGFEEHAIADLLAHQFLSQDFEKNWSQEIAAKAVVFAEIVKHHIDEEESDLLPDLKLLMTKERLLDLGKKYQQIYLNLKVEQNNKAKYSGKLEKAVNTTSVHH